MQFVDRTLLRLADAGERTAIFTPLVGANLLAAAYVFDESDIGEASAVTVRAVTLAPLVHAQRALAASGREVNSASQWQVVAELPPEHAVAAHAVIETDIATSFRGVTSEVVELDSSDLSDVANLEAVDARILATDGSLPGDAETLATRRFEELVTAIGEHFTEVPAQAVAAALDDNSLTDFDTLMAYFLPPHIGSRLAMTVVTDSTTTPITASYRIKSLVWVTEHLDQELATALREVALARAALAAGVDPQPRPSGMTIRSEYPLALLFPVENLDDDDLPFPEGPVPVGQSQRRTARLAELSTRLRSVAAVPVAI